MQVKKFEAKSIKEALQMVKQELGPEAIIISAKDNKKSFGLAGQGSVEITAAISEKSLQEKKFAENKLNSKDKEKFKTQPASIQKKFITNTVSKYQERKQTKKGSLKANLGGISRDGLDSFADLTEPVEKKTLKSRIPTSTRYIDIQDDGEARVLGKRVEDILEAFSAEPVRPLKADPEVASLKQEVQQLKELLSQFQNGIPTKKHVSQHPGAEYGLPFELSHQFEKLQTAGIDTHYIVEILDRANLDLTQIDKKKKSLVDAWVARFMMSNTEVTGEWCRSNERHKLQLFMGPSGHGKTSALIKSASHYVMEEKKRVAIFTADTFKVGAVEQLKIFCQILNVPLETIKHSIEFEKLLAKYSQYDVILVDYPGMTLRDISEIDRLRSLMPHQDTPRISHLVLSANSKDIDGYEMAQRYGVSKFDDIILNKVDESFTHGFLYNIQRKTQKPLYLFGTGSKIPEDIEIATRERVLDLIYRITKNSF